MSIERFERLKSTLLTIDEEHSVQNAIQEKISFERIHLTNSENDLSRLIIKKQTNDAAFNGDPEYKLKEVCEELEELHAKSNLTKSESKKEFDSLSGLSYGQYTEITQREASIIKIRTDKLAYVKRGFIIIFGFAGFILSILANNPAICFIGFILTIGIIVLMNMWFGSVAREYRLKKESIKFVRERENSAVKERTHYETKTAEMNKLQTLIDRINDKVNEAKNVIIIKSRLVNQISLAENNIKNQQELLNDLELKLNQVVERLSNYWDSISDMIPDAEIAS